MAAGPAVRKRVRMTEIPIHAARSPFGGRIRLAQQILVAHLGRTP